MADGRNDARGEQSVIQQVTTHHEVAAHWDVGAEEDVAGSLVDYLLGVACGLLVMHAAVSDDVYAVLT